ncbi:hypothetical protein Avi_2083 [Allorhizobium ampelinum S4]|uniref:Uncharacterized protein n=1 Tax=Allorhizobium ampelinum (strain ATCC BAA-846 / DSM 112012 / S4) TaxID=311402 RepID=B9JW58_ALLAM|nr:hypothetical protein Avi_2083 [Allorhizobium ampelinum S4]
MRLQLCAGHLDQGIIGVLFEITRHTGSPDIGGLAKLTIGDRLVLDQLLASRAGEEGRNLLQLFLSKRLGINRCRFLFEIATAGSQRDGLLVNSLVDLVFKVRISLDELCLQPSGDIRQDIVEYIGNAQRRDGLTGSIDLRIRHILRASGRTSQKRSCDNRTGNHVTEIKATETVIFAHKTHAPVCVPSARLQRQR